MNSYEVRRVYEGPSTDGGETRVLVDGLWPRGIPKGRADVDEWLKDIAPSTELRAWYHHDVSRYEEFAARYEQELSDAQHATAVNHLVELARTQPVTLLTAVRDVEHSHVPTLLRRLAGNGEPEV